MPPWASTLLAILGTGGVLTAVVVHRLTLDREARDRRNDFRGFLGRWLTDIQRVPRGDTAQTYAVYIANVQHLGGYAAKLRRDFVRRRRFQALCRDLGHLLPEHINNDGGDCRGVVASKIEALIEFV
jgi:hypothetical protein